MCIKCSREQNTIPKDRASKQEMQRCVENQDSKQSEGATDKKQILLFVCAFLGLILAVVVKHIESPCVSEFWLAGADILQAVCISILAGVVLSKFVDMPQKLNYYSKLITTSLTSFDYLESLQKGDLYRLREQVTASLYSVSTPNMPKGLLSLDGKICKLMEDPYYSVYRESVECHKPGTYKEVSGDEKDITLPAKATNLFVKKECRQNYTIDNPFGEDHSIKANIGMNNYVYLPKDCELKRLFKIEKLEVSIDDSEYKDIRHLLKVVYNQKEGEAELSPNAVTYNTGFHLALKKGKELTSDIINTSVQQDGDEEGVVYEPISSKDDLPLMAICNKHIAIRLKYSMIFPIDDNHFTKRLKYSTKSYRLDYSIESDDLRLDGQLFGPLVDQSEIVIDESNNDKHISIECFSWLLPRSGAFVVMSKR